MRIIKDFMISWLEDKIYFQKWYSISFNEPYAGRTESFSINTQKLEFSTDINDDIKDRME
jgi:hypothetical protein